MNKWILGIGALVLGTLIYTTTFAQSASTNKCVTSEAFVDGLKASTPPGESLVVNYYGPDKIKVLRDHIKTTYLSPTQQLNDFDENLLAYLESKTIGISAIFNGGCLVSVGNIPVKVINDVGIFMGGA